MAKNPKILKVDLFDKNEVVLVFKGSNAATLAARMQLHNVYVNHVAFQIISSNPIEYLITPSIGRMNPESFKDIKVIYQPTTEKSSSFFVHKLTIQYKILNEKDLGLDIKAILERTREPLRETKVKCYFYAGNAEPKILLKTTDPEFRYKDTADLNEILTQINEESRSNDFPSEINKFEDIFVPYVEEPREPSHFEGRNAENPHVTMYDGPRTRVETKAAFGYHQDSNVKVNNVKTYADLTKIPSPALKSRLFTEDTTNAPNVKSRAQFTPESICKNSSRKTPGQTAYGSNKSPICKTREHCGKPPYLDERVIKEAIQCYMRNKFGVDAFDTKPLGNKDMDEEELEKMGKRREFGKLLNEDDINKIAECIRKVNEARFSAKSKDLYEIDNLCYHRAQTIVTHKDLDSLRDKLKKAHTLVTLLALLCLILILINLLLLKVLYDEMNDKNVIEAYF